MGTGFTLGDVSGRQEKVFFHVSRRITRFRDEGVRDKKHQNHTQKEKNFGLVKIHRKKKQAEKRGEISQSTRIIWAWFYKEEISNLRGEKKTGT